MENFIERGWERMEEKIRELEKEKDSREEELLRVIEELEEEKESLKKDSRFVQKGWDKTWKEKMDLEKKVEKLEEKVEEYRKKVEVLERRLKREGKEEASKKETREGSRVENERLVEEGMGKEEETEWKKRMCLVVRKGRKWKGQELEDWVRERLGRKCYSLRRFGEDENKRLMIFEKESDRKEMLKWIGKAREEEVFNLDEFLTFEERKERFMMLERAKEVKREWERKKGKRVEVNIRGRRIEMEGEWYSWNEIEKRLEKLQIGRESEGSEEVRAKKEKVD